MDQLGDRSDLIASGRDERAYRTLAELPIAIEGYELEGQRPRVPGGFTRPSTTVRLRGGGAEGIGEDVVYDVLDHIAHRDAGPVHDLSGPSTLGEACELLGRLDLFGDAPPEREASRHYRRWAYESAALDLALRQAGPRSTRRWGATRSRFASSARPG